jgi:DNA-binding NtrC family response regulator
MNLKLSHSTCLSSGRVLVCGGDLQQSQGIEQALASSGFDVAYVQRPDLVMPALLQTPAEVCLVDSAIDDDAISALAADLHKQHCDTQLVRLISSSASADVIGHCDVLEKPYTPTALAQVVRWAAARARLLSENSRLKQRVDRLRLNQTFSRSPAMQRLMDRVREVADSDLPVLIQGEPGSGAAEIAQTLHLLSIRNQRPCVRIECSVLSADCLLRELGGQNSTLSRSNFGAGPSRLRAAEGGTLVLADVDAVALTVQRRLAELLQNSDPARHGVSETAREPRLIATTHVDLQALVRLGAFDAELLSRLAQTVLTAVPLRERKEDIASLTEQLLAEIAIREGRPRKRLTVEALELLEQHPWPGNLHELRNVIDRSCALDNSEWLTGDMLRPWIADAKFDGQANSGLTLKDMERKLIETTFARCGGNRERTAQSLQIGVRTLSGKLREYGYPPRGAPGSNLSTLERKAA